MTYTSTKKCPKCNTLGVVVNSNNPLVAGLCKDCLKKLVNCKDLVSADQFCKTYNIPFNPDKWVRMAEDLGSDMFETYIQVVMDEYKNDPDYKSANDNSSLWENVNKI